MIFYVIFGNTFYYGTPIFKKFPQSKNFSHNSQNIRENYCGKPQGK